MTERKKEQIHEWIKKWKNQLMKERKRQSIEEDQGIPRQMNNLLFGWNNCHLTGDFQIWFNNNSSMHLLINFLMHSKIY